ncbi:hypothetical protein [Microbispora rosea]
MLVLDAQPFTLLGEDDPRVAARIAVAMPSGAHQGSEGIAIRQ